MWQPRTCWSLRIHRTEIRRPCGIASRDTSASVVPKRKSPSTQATSGEFGAAKAPSGQSTKLGNVERNAALLRLAPGTYSCAAAETGEVKPIAIPRSAAVNLLIADKRLHGPTRGRLRFPLVVLDQRDTKTPRSLGQTSGHSDL